MPKETVIAHISTTRHLSPCGRGLENICCCVNVYITTRDFGAFQQHFVAQWASPLKVYHWSYIRCSFILLMAVDSPGWKADWIEIRVPQASRIHSHTNTQRSVTSAFGRFQHRELPRCCMETGADVMQAESDGVRQAEMRDAVSTLLHPVSSWSTY